MSKTNKFNTEPYYIAYIDILGYKEIVKRGDEHLAETIDLFLTEAEQIARDNQKVCGCITDINEEIFIKAFADNIIICTKKYWDILFIMVGLLQYFMLKKGYYLRGALCHSNLYFGDKFIFGEGIILAHEIESKIAKYPRIILHSSYMKAVNDQKVVPFSLLASVAGMLPLYLNDFDGYMYVNYMYIAQFTQLTGYESSIEEMLMFHKEKIERSIKDCEAQCLQKDCMEKFLWCVQYHNRLCSEDGIPQCIIDIVNPDFRWLYNWHKDD